MEKINIVIVDDSPFQISILSEVLSENGFNVVGVASSLEETKEVVGRLRPDLVTMDMTMTGTDGIECTKAIHEIDSSIKVIIVSSMMDEEIVRKARKAHVSGYIQKPVDSEEISLLINRIISSEEVFIELEQMYSKMFKESFSDVFNKLTKTVPQFVSENNINIEQSSRGIAIVLGIIGQYSGRMIYDMSFETAKKMSCNILRRVPKNSEEVLNAMGEISNMVAGNACSMINKRNKILGLRVAPPTIFYGESISISKAVLETNFSAITKTEFGEIAINIGFKRGEEEWMSNI
ncbi:MAG: response regulator [Clostridiaceae bacterium]|nr:response regulator [Clostridiaceae bacterium]